MGALLFLAYVSPFARLIDSFGVKHISYADDNTLYVNLDGNAAVTISQLNDCATSIARWFLFNDLRLNPSKSETLKVGTRHQVKSSTVNEISIAGVHVPPSKHIKLLGVQSNLIVL